MNRIPNNIETPYKIKIKTKAPNRKVTNQEFNTPLQTGAYTSIMSSLLHKYKKTLGETGFIDVSASSS